MMDTIAPSRIETLFNFDAAAFRYEPFPIGVARPVFSPEVYEELVENWPDRELFAYMPTLGRKYSLSESNNGATYRQFVEQTPIWKKLYQEIKSQEFVGAVIQLLNGQHINLGIAEDVSVNPAPSRRRWFQRTDLAHDLLNKNIRALKTRFEFSMMPADGGHIKPHTDNPDKIITLVASMVRPGEWDPAWGGGTTVLRAKDRRHSFNHMNRQLDFADADELDVFEYEPNQCVLFIKTFNSLHAVSPLTGPAGALRKTLTINIEVV